MIYFKDKKKYFMEMDTNKEILISILLQALSKFYNRI